MRVAVISLAGVLALAAVPAAAQGKGDMEPGLKDAPMPVSLWQGFYLGGNIGGAFSDPDRELAAGPGVTLLKENNDDNEFIVGAHLGYNWKHDWWPFVLGVEADLNFSSELDYLTTVRARAGFTTERALFYVTGGVAFADFGDDKFKVSEGATTIAFNSDSENQSGYVLGGGAEFAIGRNWSLGLEGLHYFFDEDKTSGVINAVPFTVEEDLDFWSVRGRLTYHFQKRQEMLPPGGALK